MNRSNANFPNHSLCQGENLDFLRMMNSESVDLIATDPPFNSGRDYFANPDSIAKGAYFPDKWAWSDEMRARHLNELKKIDPKTHYYIECVWQTLGDGALTSFLLFMSLRLVEMKRVLKSTGSIYLHCDHHASHYLKQLMDIVFGVDNFRNEIIWERVKGKGKTSQHGYKKFGTSSDTILFYTVGKNYIFNMDEVMVAKTDEELAKMYPYEDEKGRYAHKSPFRSPALGARPNLCYEYKGVKPPHSSGWTVCKEKLQELDAEGEVIWKPKGRVYRKWRAVKGKPLNNVWTDINNVSGKRYHPTQKPVVLYERFIKASSNKKDVVLDPFCGCATTLVAAQNLGRQWIGIDIHPETRTIVANRIAKACNLSSPDGSVKAQLDHLDIERDLDIHVFTKEDFPKRTN